MFLLKSIMTTDVKCVKQDTPIYEALDLIDKYHVSGLPVIDDDNRVIGLLSEKDVLGILIDKNIDSKNKVSDFMTREVVCFKETDSATDVCKFFIRSNIRRVPIVREGKLVGIVSRRDIVSLILEVKSKLFNFRYA